MPFKPKASETSNAIIPERLRTLLRQAKLHSSNKPEQTVLFQVIDSMLLDQIAAEDRIGKLEATILDLTQLINNIIIGNTSGVPVLFGFDGLDGEDSYIPGPKGDTGDTGPIGPPGLDAEDPDEPLMIPPVTP